MNPRNAANGDCVIANIVLVLLNNKLQSIVNFSNEILRQIQSLFLSPVVRRFSVNQFSRNLVLSKTSLGKNYSSHGKLQMTTECGRGDPQGANKSENER